MFDNKIGKFVAQAAKTVVVIDGFLVFILCFQPPDGGENGGIAGISVGWQTWVVLLFIISTIVYIVSLLEEIDDLKHQIKPKD